MIEEILTYLTSLIICTGLFAVVAILVKVAIILWS